MSFVKFISFTNLRKNALICLITYHKTAKYYAKKINILMYELLNYIIYF